MGKSSPATIDEYIAQFSEEIQIVLTKIREIIRKEAPAATEAMSYGIPTFKLNGNLVHFAAFKSHIGFYPTPGAIAEFSSYLKPYKTSKGAVQFPFNEPIPFPLIRKIVKFRVKCMRGNTSS